MEPLYSKQTFTVGHLKMMVTKKTNQNVYGLFIDLIVGNLMFSRVWLHEFGLYWNVYQITEKNSKLSHGSCCLIPHCIVFFELLHNCACFDFYKLEINGRKCFIGLLFSLFYLVLSTVV